MSHKMGLIASPVPSQSGIRLQYIRNTTGLRPDATVESQMQWVMVRVNSNCINLQALYASKQSTRRNNMIRALSMHTRSKRWHSWDVARQLARQKSKIAHFTEVQQGGTASFQALGPFAGNQGMIIPTQQHMPHTLSCADLISQLSKALLLRLMLYAVRALMWKIYDSREQV